jgi:hypothetical protein
MRRWKEDLIFYAVMSTAIIFPVIFVIGFVINLDIFVGYVNVILIAPLLFVYSSGMRIFWRFSSRFRGGQLFFELGSLRVAAVPILGILSFLGFAVAYYAMTKVGTGAAEVMTSVKSGSTSQWLPATLTRGVGYLPEKTVSAAWTANPWRFADLTVFKITIILVWGLAIGSGLIIAAASTSILWDATVRFFVSK